MKATYLKILDVNKVTHNVRRLTLEKPEQIKFTPGQAALLAVDKDGWREEAHPFTFTSLPDEDHFEFTIKIYPEREGVTNEISKLEVGDNVIITQVFGAIHYNGEGTFIAGGAGVTPFISIFRDLKSKGEIADNKLIFANSTEKDIINKEEFETILGNHFYNILSDEENDHYAHGYIDSEYLKNKINPNVETFYICGPPPMMKAVEKALKNLGVTDSQIIKEKF